MTAVGLFSRTIAWAREQGWILATEEDDDAAEGQALLEAPEDHQAHTMWPTAAQMPIVLFVPEDAQRVAVYCLVVEDIPAQARSQVAELVTRANRGLLGGAFELDLDDGDLRFRSDLDIGAAQLDDDQLAQLLGPLLDVNLETVEVYAAAIVEVLTGRTSALAAVQAAESEE